MQVIVEYVQLTPDRRSSARHGFERDHPTQLFRAAQCDVDLLGANRTVAMVGSGRSAIQHPRAPLGLMALRFAADEAIVNQALEVFSGRVVVQPSGLGKVANSHGSPLLQLMQQVDSAQ